MRRISITTSLSSVPAQAGFSAAKKQIPISFKDFLEGAAISPWLGHICDFPNNLTGLSMNLLYTCVLYT